LEVIEQMDDLKRVQHVQHSRGEKERVIRVARTLSLKLAFVVGVLLLWVSNSNPLFAYQYGSPQQPHNSPYPTDSLLLPRNAAPVYPNASVGIQNERQMRIQAQPASAVLPNHDNVRLSRALSDALLSGDKAGGKDDPWGGGPDAMGPAAKSPHPKDDAKPLSPGPDGKTVDPHAEVFAHEQYPPAYKCAQCHKRIYDEWRVSSHAYASVSPMQSLIPASGLFSLPHAFRREENSYAS